MTPAGEKILSLSSTGQTNQQLAQHKQNAGVVSQFSLAFRLLNLPQVQYVALRVKCQEEL